MTAADGRAGGRGGAGALALVVAAALALQWALFGFGFYRVAADESARSLIAQHLSWGNALEPYIWPPFYKLFVGVALKVWDDVFLVPRILSSLAGLLSILALARLAHLLFGDRRATLLTAVLAVAFPHRLVFSVAPMSDIYGYLFLLAAAGCALAWLRRGSTAELMLACACLFGAETVRFEAGFFALALFLLVLHRWLLRRELGFLPVAAAAAILFGFPLFWIADSLFWYGSLDNLAITGKQYTANFGTSRVQAMYLSPLGRNLALDIVWNPLMLAGLAMLASTVQRDTAARAWALAFGAPLLLITAAMVATLSLPMAAPWRTTGTWALLLLPFEAAAILRAVGWFADRRARGLAAAALLAAALLPPAVRSGVYVREGMTDPQTHGPRAEREAGLDAVRRLDRAGGGTVLVDSFRNLDFLDVLAGSGEPDRFVLSHGSDPLAVANDLPLGGVLPPDRFDLANGAVRAATAPEDVRVLLVRTPRFVAALDAAPGRWQRVGEFGAWVEYRRAGDDASAAGSGPRRPAPSGSAEAGPARY